MTVPHQARQFPESRRIIAILWGLGIAAAALNQVAGAVKAAVPEKVSQREKTVQEAAAHLRASPPANGRALVLFTENTSEDSVYFSYRLQYLAYPLRIDRFYFPWEGMRAESYRDIYLCDDLTILLPRDIESQSGTVFRLRTPISTARLHGAAR